MTDTLTLPYFDGAVVIILEYSDTAEELAALDRFLTKTPADRKPDARHVYAYYRDIHRAVDGADWLDAEMGVPATPQDIWPHVTPIGIMAVTDHHDGQVYVVIEANCVWAAEHGLMMVWRAGKTLNKLGGYDGHVTNANAYDDDTKGNVVYSGIDDEFTTYLTE